MGFIKVFFFQKKTEIFFKPDIASLLSGMTEINRIIVSNIDGVISLREFPPIQPFLTLLKNSRTEGILKSYHFLTYLQEICD